MTRRDVPLGKDGVIDVDQMDAADVCKVFERELDLVHTKGVTSFEDPAPGMSAPERERFERECEQWRDALKTHLRQNLWNHGITIDRVTWNHLDGVFRVSARDRQHTHRDYSAEIQVSEALGLAEMHNAGPFASVVEEVTRRILAAREHYLARMS